MESFKYFLREVWLFLSSAIFLTNFAKMLAVIVGLVILTNWGLRCHTRFGESVEVNDFTGKRLSDAKKQGRDKGFRFEVIDSVWREGEPGGMIDSQDPQPHARVKEGRKIYVTITQWKAEQVRLPLLSESSYDYDQYAAKIARRQVKSKVKEKVFDRRQAENTILHLYFNDKQVTERDIKDGFDVPMGSTLEFVVTERLSNELNVPNLVCMDFSAAEFLVSNSNLNLGEVLEDETVTDRGSAYILKQEPPSDSTSTIRMGGQISVWLTQNLPPGCREN